MAFGSRPVGKRPHDRPVGHGSLGHHTVTPDDELGPEHGGDGFGGEDTDHLEGGAPELDETESKLAALKEIGHHARKAMAMHLREKMPKQHVPEHNPMEAGGAEDHRSILEDDDRAKADKLKRLMMMHSD